MIGLERLEENIRRDIDMTRYPDREWVKPRFARDGQPVLDALIIGAGQCGLAVGYALKRDQISNIRLVDAAPTPDRQGPWKTFARMETLRSPKHFTGPDLGMASLTFESWYVAQYGQQNWEQLDKIPKELWQDYLCWFGGVTELPITYGRSVKAIRTEDNYFAVDVRNEQGEESTLKARHVIQATGATGNGCWSVPAPIGETLNRNSYWLAHSDIPYNTFNGRKVVVVGGAASAFDNAATAAEHGAESVSVLVRNRELKRVNPHKWTEFSGFLNDFRHLPDVAKWAIMAPIIEHGEPVPPATFLRALKHENLKVYLGAPVETAYQNEHDRRVSLETPVGTFTADEVVICAGMDIDLSAVPELCGLHDQIACWQDRHPEYPDIEKFGAFPYLGEHLQYMEKRRGSMPLLSRIYNLTAGSTLSHGPSGASINGLKEAARQVAAGIRLNLFTDDLDSHIRESLEFAEEEMTHSMPNNVIEPLNFAKKERA